MPKYLKCYKDKEKARRTRNKHRRQNYQKTAFAPNSGKLWSEYEDAIILEHTVTDFELAKLLKRSVGSIQNRRCRLKKKESNNE